ncbi:hypothetical protein ACQKGB_28970 [Bacillus tropicus]|uniref:hypothetical protein n=1 Tax=Bacillus tropicus TaxID=2026188 RepID=UPI003D077328
MGKSKRRNSSSDRSAPKKTAPGDQFLQDRAVRQRAHMALSNLRPAQMPLLLDALDAAAAPVVEHLDRYAQVVPELDAFRRTRAVGPYLSRWCQLSGLSPEALLVHRENYFGFAAANDPSQGFVEEGLMKAMYCAYRCTAGATTDRHAYYASEEMTALVLAGSETSAEVSVRVDDLPSPSGVAYLAHAETPLMLLWRLNDLVLEVQLVRARGVQEFIGHDGALQAGSGFRFINHVYLPFLTAEAELSPPDSDEVPCLRMTGGFSLKVSADDKPDEREIYTGWTPAKILEVFISFTHMLRQGPGLVETTEVAGGKSPGARRRPSTVTYVTYRQRTARSRDDADQAPTRVYSNRWVVRGHWRRHWYPSEERHHPKWISSYIAGPEGAPIKTRDKVTIVRP